MTFIDGFVAAVPTAKKQAYIDHAMAAGAVFKRHGALGVVETWGDDVPDGKLTSFPMAVKATDDETVVMSWVLWPSRTARDEAWPKIMADPDMASMDMKTMPFDGKRLIFGGFETIVEL